MARLQIPRAAAATLDAATPLIGEVVGDTTNNRPRYGDGLTAGGKPIAFKSEIDTIPSNSNLSAGVVTATGSTTARTLAERFADEINLLDWGVTLNSSAAAAANTSAINAALTYAYDNDKAVVLPAGTLYVAEASGSPGYCLLNKGVPIRGAGRNASIVAPVSSLAATASIMRIQPPTGDNLDMLALLDFMIYMNISGSAKGKHGIHLLTDVTTNVNGFYMRGIYIAAGNDYSLRMENDGATNVQGCPANSVIEACQFMEGVNATYHGDNLTFFNCTLRSSSTRLGIRTYACDTSGVAGALSIVSCNFDCAGGAIQVIRGRHVNVLYNNIEHSAGAGANAAVVDIDGSSGTITGKNVVRGNHIGIFGTSTATIALRVNATDDIIVEENDLEAGISVANGISITASASGVVVGPNTISGFSTAISNSGTGTLRRSTVPFTTVDNTVARYDSTAGALQTTSVVIDDSNNITPSTNDTGALGTASLSWADLFLASGGVVNFANGDVTLTHSSDTLTLGGGVFVTPTGSATAPPVAIGAATRGFWDATSAIGLTIGGSSQWQFGQHLLATNGGKILVGNGSAAAPTLTFANDSDNGYYYIGTNNFGATAGGALVYDVSTGGITMASGMRINLQNSQSTVGAAGGASALPATPTGYIPIKVAGTEYVVPYYAKT